MSRVSVQKKTRKNKRRLGVPVKRIRGKYYKTRGSIGSLKHRRVAEKLAVFIASEGHSLHEVNKWGFVNLLREVIDPAYLPPSSKSLTRMILNLGLKARILVGTVLRNKEVVVTADIATVTTTTMGYLVMTAHYIAESTIDSVTLAARQLNCRHTADEIYSQLCLIIEDFGLKTKQIVGAVTDGGANMVKAMRMLVGKDQHIVCINHTIHNIVKRSLKDSKELSSTFEKLHKLVTYFKHSTLAMDKLRNSQEECGVLPSNITYLKRAIKPRWNSEYLSAKSYLDMECYVNKALEDDADHENLNEDEVTHLQDYIGITAVMYELTSMYSGEKYPTVNLVIPGLKYAMYKMGNFAAKTQEGKAMKDSLIKQLQALLNELHLSRIHIKATLLDPRYRSDHLDVSANAKAVEIVNSLLKEERSKSDDSLDASLMDGSIFQPYLVQQIKEKIEAWSTSYDRELKHYLNCPTEDFDANPIQYWQNRIEGFSPFLSKIALRALLIPASSTASERAVSALNLIAVKKRARLTKKNVDILVFLKCLDKKHWKIISP
ncbi:uncharacterized protein LOC135948493 isoform X2 [Cloeon dipterum]|uniref:uncharacterized protein LOC135948493 isoform X2 n=1 Tax=Cloeon dipterum TaxID=197152 RepID=UPI003220A157